MDTQFLQIAIKKWDENLAYLSACNKLKNIRVANNSNKRGGEFSFDFLSNAINKENYQNALQIVENNEIRIPGQGNQNKHSKAPYLHVT